MQENAQSGSIRLTVEDNVATIAIDRPERKNAMTQAMWRELTSLMGQLAADATVRAVVLTGQGNDFCAGADIGEFDTVRGNAHSARLYEAENSAAFSAIRNCPVPTIAAIRGICFGGGFGLAAACDLRLGSATALFCVPPARLGLAYPVDAMSDIVHAVGPQMARYLSYTAARIDADAALDAGFLLEIVEPTGLERRASELAAAIATNAPLSIKASKASIRASLTQTRQDIDTATTLGDATFESADYAEGRAAFREKRPAIFTGR
ncbi:enoyl-CoA hydratase-related protein [Mesorhizobium sp. CAU 1741]|uniref:enoyl-CoA hydratase/isomerase family protein n=1 Tax=Mesorhizobium sp. CAU 1741 TaxID=3140366 RepID=UPI00325B38FB